ncbi:MULTISPECIES: uroporphyrinogen-III synthase [Olivibacter]|uniref:Uroporphyrinogen III synthase HEM4 n=3 Tax=Sphingobacteriaceae TaxID=84566 RepID=F4C7S2_SPHS2|nr:MULTISPECIES: uroporphyrinogen-III synthase [Olivibacter]MCL4642017.1 uroporphyrinogen-III synthase [Olivibacter sp. UJ_SKK_5.1]MDM8173940.1 uroporphyrinogen-III synthase [Olivibacter sp. 47]MDX3915125.1 uroporphyrinogen-III synthase [Pseudosphingobacterium sp.]QEL03727.1 uroporphyrinogen-III synthase [Olivibacter sp. LS-1]
MAAEDREKKVKSILVTLPRPENDKSPYFALASKYNLKLDFRAFIHVEGVPAREFRKERINLADFTAVIFTSRNAADHFFRICEEMRYEVPADLKYFCLSETIALYLQKYIQYRKRKIFFGKQTAQDLEEVLKKHAKEKFLYPCSDVANEETQNWLQENGYDFTPAVLFRTVVSDLSDLANVFYDIIVFFSPSSIQSLFENFPDFKQNDTRIAAFGPSTHQAIADRNLILDIAAPTPEAPSMTMAVEQYIKKVNK